jgi:hypothetical protein
MIQYPVSGYKAPRQKGSRKVALDSHYFSTQLYLPSHRLTTVKKATRGSIIG